MFGVMLKKARVLAREESSVSLLNHLTPGEEVLSRLEHYYATSHRVLWYAETPKGEELAELPYYRLRSVELVRAPSHGLMVGGTVMTLAGFLLSLYLGFITGPLAIVFGLGMLFLGAYGKESHYQLNGDNLSREEQARWRIPYRGSMDFIVVVGQRSGRRLNEG